MKNDNIITLNTVVCRNGTRFMANTLGEEIVMMDMENGDFISMNKVGADIWCLSDKPLSVQELLNKLTTLYNTTEAVCMNETMQFVQSGMQQKIFIRSDANA